VLFFTSREGGGCPLGSGPVEVLESLPSQFRHAGLGMPQQREQNFNPPQLIHLNSDDRHWFRQLLSPYNLFDGKGRYFSRKK
jgi:hypothetical protein